MAVPELIYSVVLKWAEDWQMTFDYDYDYDYDCDTGLRLRSLYTRSITYI